MGPIKTILIGKRILYPALFQTIGESVPKKDLSFQGKTRASDPKSAFEINIKANAEIRKKITNFVLEMFMLIERRIPCVSYRRKHIAFCSARFTPTQKFGVGVHALRILQLYSVQAATCRFFIPSQVEELTTFLSVRSFLVRHSFSDGGSEGGSPSCGERSRTIKIVNPVRGRDTLRALMWPLTG